MPLSNLSQITEGLTYDDVLLIPNYSEVLPREVNIQSKISILIGTLIFTRAEAQ